jgi:hypothetical protein
MATPHHQQDAVHQGSQHRYVCHVQDLRRIEQNEVELLGQLLDHLLQLAGRQ